MRQLTKLSLVSMALALCISWGNNYTETTDTENFGGFDSQVAWGEHLVAIGDCIACHTPSIMTDKGPVKDMSRYLSGRPADAPAIDIDRNEIQTKGLAITGDLTEWVGPWGVSYSANLTPDPTGLGNWTEEQFIYALRNGKFKGTPDSRPMLPPMPWEAYAHMSDNEMKAVFAYLQSIEPISNLVPAALPPAAPQESAEE